ncbi:MAG: ribosome assembly RNA-binding protein YhbY [Proteobacteria bacterium]|nr:ribosome assembly RNA-binding protein YhbY [Pseudomonadota bacterium]
MALTSKQRSFLRGKAHELKPVVMIGKGGLTENVLKALYDALRSHELIKIKIPADSQDDLKEVVDEIMSASVGLEKVQIIGHLLVVFRPSTPLGKISKELKESKIPYTRAQQTAAAEESNQGEEEE